MGLAASDGGLDVGGPRGDDDEGRLGGFRRQEPDVLDGGAEDGVEGDRLWNVYKLRSFSGGVLCVAKEAMEEAFKVRSGDQEEKRETERERETKLHERMRFGDCVVQQMELESVDD